MATRREALGRLSSFVTLVCLGGCATKPVRLADGPREFVATDYEAVLKRWTRTEMLLSVSELENHLTATATFESWEFKWAYVIRFADDYRLTVAERQAKLTKELEATKLQHSFFVAVTGSDHKLNDLSDKDGAWIVRLTDSEGGETVPEEVTLIRRPTAIEKTYFPYNTPFRRAFHIRFPVVRADGRPSIAKEATWMGLRFAGARGNSELVWELS